MTGANRPPRPPTDEDLSAWLDGELHPARRAEVERALDADPALRARLEQLAAVDEALASAPVPPVSEALAARVRARLREEQRAERLRRIAGTAPRRRPIAGRRMALGLAAAAAAVFALVVLTRQPTRIGPPGPSGEVVAEADTRSAETVSASPEVARRQGPAQGAAPGPVRPDTAGASGTLEGLAELDPEHLLEALEEEGVSPEEMAIALDLDTLEDLPVIEQLELLEQLARLEAEGGWS